MANKKPLISVIIPVFKVESYLERCVDSVINQTYKNLEIILVDDGSPDNCPQMCDNYAKADKRIKVVHKKNGGLSDARNAGTQIASGDYVIYVDSDDYIELDTIDTLYNNLKTHNADISFASFSTFSNETISNKNTANEVEVLNTTDAMMRFATKGAVEFVVAWCKLYKKELLSKTPFPVGKLHEDEFSTYKIFAKANTIVKSSSSLYNYYIRSGSIMQSKKLQNYIDIFEAVNERFDFYKTNFKEIYKPFMQKHFAAIVNTFMYMNGFKELSHSQKKFYLKIIKARIKELKNENIKIPHSLSINFKLAFPKLSCTIKKLKDKK